MARYFVQILPCLSWVAFNAVILLRPLYAIGGILGWTWDGRRIWYVIMEILIIRYRQNARLGRRGGCYIVQKRWDC